MTKNHTAIWHPYTQMRCPPPRHTVKKAEGVYIFLDDGRKLVDGIASWWSVIHGYNHPEITAAAKSQMGQLPHVMMGGLTNAPAEEFARRLTEITLGDPGGPCGKAGQSSYLLL